MKKNKKEKNYSQKESKFKKILKKYKLPIIIGTVILIILIIVLVFFLLNKHEDKKVIEKTKPEEPVKEDYEEGTDDYFMENVEEPVQTPSTGNDYYDFINTPISSVNISELKQRNPDTVGFLKVNNTNVNYPVVKTTNNDYYLTHAFNKSYNSAGWVFMDYRNGVNNLDDNTIIYGHGSLKTTMFGTLKNVVKREWYTNSSNTTITLITSKYKLYWKIFSIYTIPDETYYLISNFGTDESHQKFINTMLSRSIYNFGESVTVNDKLLTLSTCYNNQLRLVVQAKLARIESN